MRLAFKKNSIVIFERTTDLHLFYLLNNVGGLLKAKSGVIMLGR